LAFQRPRPRVAPAPVSERLLPGREGERLMFYLNEVGALAVAPRYFTAKTKL